jgi:hypothetical protein
MSQAAGPKSSAPVHVHQSDEKVLLHGPQDDIIMRTGKQIIDACELHTSLDLWRHEFNDMLDFVKDESQKFSSQIEACYLSPRGTKLLLIFIQISPSFDFELADKLTELGINLRNRFNVGFTELMQVPSREADRFIDFNGAVHVFGKSAESYQTDATQSPPA